MKYFSSVTQHVRCDPWSLLGKNLLHKADIQIEGTRPWDIRIRHPGFFKRIMLQGLLGLGESYMDGWWECDRLDIFIYKFLAHKLDEAVPGNFRDILLVLSENIFNRKSDDCHGSVFVNEYDIGYDVFTHMLDPYMQYSCGYWRKGATLAEAQEAKLKMICEKLQLAPGMRVLDIGCGWGGTAEYSARHYDVYVEGTTNSTEEQKIAQSRCQGLDITIMLEDYQDLLDDKFDRIIALGALEYLELKNYQNFFKALARCLKPDGLFLLHSTGSTELVSHVGPWLNKYIFPKGCLPSGQQLVQSIEPYFRIEDWDNLGTDYDKTLMSWFEKINESWPSLSMNYSPGFRHMLEYYLCSSAGFFRAGKIQLRQLLLCLGGEGQII
ncbi:cyclopropane fatty acyl phospholipid synthase [Rahnella selenatireducens]|uniref:cyclopropane fatty acyl phospholipid synthase n=1 Tax=Rahnella selenatireducens TaxID=3389797 RepID=UPI003969646F